MPPGQQDPAGQQPPFQEQDTAGQNPSNRQPPPTLQDQPGAPSVPRGQRDQESGRGAPLQDQPVADQAAPQIRIEGGIEHQFPPDFTKREIDDALASYQSAPTKQEGRATEPPRSRPATAPESVGATTKAGAAPPARDPGEQRASVAPESRARVLGETNHPEDAAALPEPPGPQRRSILTPDQQQRASARWVRGRRNRLLDAAMADDGLDLEAELLERGYSWDQVNAMTPDALVDLVMSPRPARRGRGGRIADDTEEA